MSGGWHGLKGVLVCTGVKNMPAAPFMPNLGSIDIDGGEQDHQQVWPENTCQQFPNMQQGLPRVASLYSVTVFTADRSSASCIVVMQHILSAPPGAGHVAGGHTLEIQSQGCPSCSLCNPILSQTMHGLP